MLLNTDWHGVTAPDGYGRKGFEGGYPRNTGRIISQEREPVRPCRVMLLCSENIHAYRSMRYARPRTPYVQAHVPK